MKGKIYAYNQEQWEKISQIEYFSQKQLDVVELENGIVLPSLEMEKPGEYKGGVCDSEFNFVAGFLRNGTDPTKAPGYYGVNSAYRVSQSEIIVCDETVIFGGILIGHFGHFILESMGRLWYHVQNQNLPYRIVFTVELVKKKWFADFFRLLGIDESRICFVERPTQFKKIIIPEEAVHSWHSYTKEYLLPYEKITDNIKPAEYKKVYLTRTQFSEGGAACCNEEYFEDFYREKGFVVVAPEKYSIEEQISIVNGADEIVTTLGSISHFAMFCKKGTRFTVLTRVDDDVLPAQCLVNEASNVEWCIVDVSLNFLYATRVDGVNLIGVTNSWKNYVKDNWIEETIEDTLKQSCYEYIYKWCEYYANPWHYKKIKDKDFFEFFSRMSKVLCGITLDKSKFNLETKRELLQKIEKQDIQLEKIAKSRIENYRKDKELQLYRRFLKEIANMPISIWNIKKHRKMIERLLSDINRERERALLLYQLHVENKGWLPDVIEDDTWENKEKLQVEAIKIYFKEKKCHVFYSTLTENNGWSKTATDGEISGSTGKHIPLIGICIWLDEEMQKSYDVSYRCYNEAEGWNEWKKNGEKNVVGKKNVVETLEIAINIKDYME